jgi:hypothetical protein
MIQRIVEKHPVSEARLSGSFSLQGKEADEGSYP